MTTIKDNDFTYTYEGDINEIKEYIYEDAEGNYYTPDIYCIVCHLCKPVGPLRGTFGRYIDYGIKEYPKIYIDNKQLVDRTNFVIQFVSLYNKYNKNQFKFNSNGELVYYVNHERMWDSCINPYISNIVIYQPCVINHDLEYAECYSSCKLGTVKRLKIMANGVKYDNAYTIVTDGEITKFKESLFIFGLIIIAYASYLDLSKYFG